MTNFPLSDSSKSVRNTADEKAEYIEPSVKLSISSRYFAYKIPEETEIAKLHTFTHTDKISIKQQKMTVYFQTLKVEISSYK